MFALKNKVALISGGASGIGFQYAKQLLKNGLKGITLADINDDFGKNALLEIESNFGKNSAIYVKTDVRSKSNFEDAFKATVEKYGNLDIVINNAGILNDSTWEKEIDINLKGCIHGTLLAFETYLPKHKSGKEGLIVNISSIAGVKPNPFLPIYSGSKFGVLGFSTSFGHQMNYERSKIRVLTICPGVTDTPLMADTQNTTLGPSYSELYKKILENFPKQNPESVALGFIEVLKNAQSGTIWVIEDNEQPYEFILPDRQSFAKK